MTEIIFYEKPGCRTNARQKLLLAAAGHVITAKNLLTEPWTGDRLREFFGATPVASWFNAAAPRIESGEIDPGAFDAAAALATLVEDPLLIRRPLVEANGLRCAGFDREPVISLLGGTANADAEGCSRPGPSQHCPDPDPTSKSSAL
ncbi:ArsC/Spx/MgsR family protein [Rhodopseudomonas sp. RCAM05734]|uniref:ArsC/Spx/MgsR family protein n=1 Tax=Rhodopseudomonas sp. RCAM05734 TaxID=3457549 RepID=UPI004044DF50